MALEREPDPARRILRPEGILVLSTPNKKTYRRLGDTPANPFHVHEFHLRGLRRALAAVFPEVVILGQSRTEGAYFYPERTDGGGATARGDHDADERALARRLRAPSARQLLGRRLGGGWKMGRAAQRYSASRHGGGSAPEAV